MIFAASIGGLELPVSNEVLGVAVFVVVLIVTYVVARVVARFVGEKVRQQHVRTELVPLRSKPPGTAEWWSHGGPSPRW